jgi:hypothetical protein
VLLPASTAEFVGYNIITRRYQIYFVSLWTVWRHIRIMAYNTDDDASNDGSDAAADNLWVYVALSFVACVSFWCQSVVTEER